MMLRLLTLVVATLASFTASAAEHTVQMKNQGTNGIMVFEPAVLKVAVGDTVTFEPSDMGHNSQSNPSMSPAGASGRTGGINQRSQSRLIRCLRLQMPTTSGVSNGRGVSG